VTLYPSIALNELEVDAFTEIANIGVSRAASSLRELVGEEVRVSVPSVAIVTHEQAVRTIVERETDTLVAVQQAFAGDIYGRALLIFPETSSLELVRAAFGGELPLEDIINLESEALAEIGNVILNGCLATIANMLQRNLEMSLPEVLHGTGSELFGLSSVSDFEEAMLFLYIDFTVKRRDIRGYIAIVMDLPALASLKVLIGDLIARTMSDPDDAYAAT
jgi:chemotaxis protein CheC